MGYFTNDHFKLLNKWRGQKWDGTNPEQKKVYAELKEAYAITEAWAQQLQKMLFPAGPPPRLMKKPINQGGVFERYNWARIYPSTDAPKALAYTVGVDADLGFVVKIDTVQADGELRARYEKLRGPMSDASPIVAVLPAEQGLAKQSISELVKWSATSIKNFTLRYDEVAQKLGINAAMDDAAVLARFATNPEFKQSLAKWSPADVARLCKLARAVHDAGLDWWHTQIAGPQVRFGRKQPGQNRAAGVLGYLHCGRKLQVQINRAVEGLEGRNWMDLSPSLVDAIANELVNSRDAIEDWKPVSGERPGYWPDQLQSEPSDPGDSSKAPIDVDVDQSTAVIKAFNRIYYGPPGTGKTYELSRLLKAEYEEETSTVSSNEWRGQFIAERIAGLTWWEGAAAALCELGGEADVDQIIGHPFVLAIAGAKGRNKNVRQTLWGALQSHTIEDSITVKTKARLAPAVFDKTGDSVWSLVGEWGDAGVDLRALVAEYQAGPPQTGERVKRYSFVTFHQSFGYEEFVEGLRPVLAGDSDSSDIAYEIREGTFKELCRKARLAPTKRFAMFIDEINRGNISKIFGELITLIELDKREAGENETTVTLPYSGEAFTVPANVDIIGTMNTADRSLALVDTALRRRFDFVACYPDTRGKKVEGEDGSAPLAGLSVESQGLVIDVRLMLERINQRIEALYDRDHMIGHAYFTRLLQVPPAERFDALADIFKNRVIPLLEEYFFEDWQKIRLVLGDNQKKEEEARFIFTEGESGDLEGLFGNEPGLDSHCVKPRFGVQSAAFSNPKSYIGVYA